MTGEFPCGHSEQLDCVKTLAEPFDAAQGERISTQFYETTAFGVRLNRTVNAVFTQSDSSEEFFFLVKSRANSN